jgi:tetratricopeptide (TPR) repeat protein
VLFFNFKQINLQDFSMTRMMKFFPGLILLFLFTLNVTHSQSAQEYFAKGLDRLDRKDSKRNSSLAILYFDTAIAIQPDYVDAYMNRARAKQKESNLIGAFDDYSKAIELKPNLVEAYKQRALLRNWFGGPEEIHNHAAALADLNKAIELAPYDYKSYMQRAYLKSSELQDQQGALADFSKALKLKPNFAEAYTAMGMIKIDLGQRREGCLDIQYAAELKDYWAQEFLKQRCK